MQPLTGTFPFGQPSGRCEPRKVPDAQALVLGVYPSALHIRWTGPERISALAVAEEPWPFWPGDDEVALVEQWKKTVGWRDEWGTADPVGRLNGSSGRAVAQRVIAPLHLTAERVWMTDALPFFHVDRAEKKQGDVMRAKYDPFARAHHLPEHRLPDRPSPSQLIRRAVDEEGERILDEIVESSAPLVITLGNEALAVASELFDGELPRRLSRDDYGRRHPAAVRGTTVEVLPLVHPGQRSAEWTAAHDAWMSSRA